MYVCVCVCVMFYVWYDDTFSKRPSTATVHISRAALLVFTLDSFREQNRLSVFVREKSESDAYDLYMFIAT